MDYYETRRGPEALCVSTVKNTGNYNGKRVNLWDIR